MASLASQIWHRIPFAAIREPSLGRYLQGLTWGRFGLVLLLCAVFAARQVGQMFAEVLSQACGECKSFSSVPVALFIGIHFVSALPMLFLVTVADNITRHSSRTLRILGLTAAVILGAIAFAFAFNFLQIEFFRGGNSLNSRSDIMRLIPRLAFFMRAAFYGALATTVLYLFVREREERQTLHDAMVAKVALDRETVEARLQALQAQIEPHFLFNTLANIGLLYEVDRHQAKLLIHSLSSYLAAALPHMREASSTVGRELAMVKAYLDIFRVRMGDRLKVSIDVPDVLHGAPMPPMMLLTLAENAIKHGINPRPRGGSISIRAECNGSILRIAVDDDGVGFGRGKGTGIGLANIRARLSVLHGTAARLLLEGNAEGGLTAAIELPWKNTVALTSET